MLDVVLFLHYTWVKYCLMMNCLGCWNEADLLSCRVAWHYFFFLTSAHQEVMAVVHLTLSASSRWSFLGCDRGTVA